LWPPVGYDSFSMTESRPFSLLLIGVYALGLAGLVLGAVQRWWPRGLDEAVRELADGDCDGRERRQLLRIVLDQGSASAALQQRAQAAMAAVELEQEAPFLALVGGAPSGLADLVRADGEVQALGLGDDLLLRLASAARLEARGEQAAARRAYEQVAASSRLYGMELCPKLCQQAAARLR
jgi:hypothetical protein